MFKLNIKNNNCVVDIGTNKTICVIFTNDKKNNAKILSWGHKKTFGVNKSIVTNFNSFSNTLLKVLTEAKINKLIKNKKIVSNITDKGVYYERNFSYINLDGLKIRKKDIDKIKKKNSQKSYKKNMYLIHSFPLKYKLNENEFLKEPIGINCQRLELESINIYVKNKLISNLANGFKDSNLVISDLIDSAYASSIGCLSDEEKKIGSICIDIGAGTSKISIFINGKPEFIDYIPLGGNDVTNDIANGLEMSNELSEYIKIVQGSIQFSSNEKLKINMPNGTEKIITKNLLNGIIKPRYEEIFELIRERIYSKITENLPIKKVVLTGGASQIEGAINLSEKIFNRKSQLSGPNTKLSYFNKKPEFSTIIGLILSQKNLSQLHWNNSNYGIKRAFKVIDSFDDWITDSFT